MKKIIFFLALIFMASMGYVGAQNFASQNQETLSSSNVTLQQHENSRADYVLKYYNGSLASTLGWNTLTGTRYISGCISFTSGQMYNYAGGVLNKISVPLPSTANMAGLSAAKVWIKTALNGAVVYEQSFTPTLGTWTEVVLTTPYTLPANTGLVIGFTTTHTGLVSGDVVRPLWITAATDPYQVGGMNYLSSTSPTGHEAGASWYTYTTAGNLGIEGYLTGVTPLPANDLCATTVTSAPLKWVGNATTYIVNVVNTGTASQNAYTVQLIDAANAVLATQNVTTALAAGASANINLTYTPTAAGTVSVRGKVILAGDAVPANDICAPLQIRIYPMQPMAYCNSLCDNGLGSSIATWSGAIGYPVANMTPFVGKRLTAIEVALPEAASVYENCSVWIRSSLTGANLYTQPFTPVTGWNVITLTTPQTLTSADTYIGYTFTSNTQCYPLGLSSGNMNSANGGHYSTGSSWLLLSGISGLNANNAIIGVVDNVSVTPGDCNPATNLQVNYIAGCKASLTWTAPAKSAVTKPTKEFPTVERIHKHKSNMRGNVFTSNNPLKTHKSFASSRGNTAYGLIANYMYFQWDVDDYDDYDFINILEDDEILSATYYDGKIYAYGWDYDTEEDFFYIINHTTGNIISRIPFTQGYYVTGLAYDHSTNTMYGIGYDAATWTDRTFTVNLTTGALSNIHNITGFTGDWPITLAINLQGTAYVIDFAADEDLVATAYGKIYQMNKATGACTAGVSTGRYVMGYDQSMAFDLTDGTLYWAEVNDGVHHTDQCNWCKINPATGVTTIITADIDEQVYGLNFVYPAVSAPTTYNIYRDGVKVNTTPVTATTYTDQGFNASEGHTWGVKVICEMGGESAPVTVEKAACPQGECDPVTNLTGEFTKECVMELSWTPIGKSMNTITPIIPETHIATPEEMERDAQKEKMELNGTASVNIYTLHDPDANLNPPGEFIATGESLRGDFFYGFRTGWAEPQGHLKIPVANPTTASLQSPFNPSTSILGGEYFDGYYYASENVSPYPLYKVNHTTGTYTTLTTGFTSFFNDLTYNYANNTMYALKNPATIYTIDVETGTATQLSTISGAPGNGFITIACNAAGNMYGIELANEGTPAGFYSINPTAGTCTLIGSTGLSARFAQSMTFDRETGILYWCAYIGSGVSYYTTVNVTTGLATQLSSTYCGEICACYTPYVANPNIAKAPTNFTAVQQGATYNVNLSWTNPTQTLAGAPLTSITSIVLKRGATTLQTFPNPTPGGNMTYTDAIGNYGTYSYTVYAVTSEGNGQSASATVNIGQNFGNCLGKVVGTGTTTQYELPLNTFYRYSYSQQIFTAAELGAVPQKITGIAFSAIKPNLPRTNQTIYLANVDKNEFTSVTDWIPLSQLTPVYTGNITFIGGDWFNINLSEPFIYTGGNLVLVYLNNHGNYEDSQPTFRAHTASGNKTLHYRVDGSTPINPASPPSAYARTATRTNTRFIMCPMPTYNVYMDDDLVISTKFTHYSHSGFDNETSHCWSVTVTCEEGGESPAVSICKDPCVPCLPVTDLEAAYDASCGALLTWNVAGKGIKFAAPVPETTQEPVQGEKTREVMVDVNPNGHTTNSQATRDWPYQQQFQWDITGFEPTYKAAIATDGNFVYIGRWNDSQIAKLDMSGNFIENFTIPGVSALRGLTYDGTNFYGSNAAASFWKLDMNAHTVLSTTSIAGGVQARYISYDPTVDAFWVGNWAGPAAEDIVLINKTTGAEIRRISASVHTLSSLYGTAVDHITPGGPYLFTVQADGDPATVHRINLITGQLTSQSFTTPFDSGGGMFFSSSVVPGTWTLGCLIQNQCVYGWKIADSNPNLAAAPNPFTATPIGITPKCKLVWTNPTQTVGGATLTSITKIVVERNGTPIYTNFTVTPGQNMNYTDNAPAIGNYSYAVYAVTSEGNGQKASASATLGNFCNFTFQMTDANNDGWDNGAAIVIKVDGVSQGEVRLSSGGSGTVVKSLPAGNIEFLWKKGSPATYDYECGFKIFDFNNTQIYSITSVPSSWANNYKFLEYESDCGVVPGIFNIYRDDELIAAAWDGGAYYYDDGDFDPYIDHTWTVATACTQWPESDPVSVTLGPCKCRPITDLTVAYTDNCNAELNWEAPNYGKKSASQVIYKQEITVNENAVRPDAKAKGGNTANIPMILGAHANIQPDRAPDDYIKWTTGVIDDALGNGNYPIDMIGAARFLPADLSTLSIVDGDIITKVKFATYDAVASPVSCYTIKIYQGGTSPTNPGTLAYQQTVTGTVNMGAYTEIPLTTPYAINAAQELWIAVHVQSSNPGYYLGIDAGPGIANKGDVLCWNGEWQTLGGAGFSANWNIEAFVQTGNPNLAAAPNPFTATPIGLTTKCNLAWTNPTQTFGGNPLTNITKMVVERNGVQIKEFTNVTPGQNMTYKDVTVPTAGTYTYTVYAVTSAGNGQKASATATLGQFCDYTIEMWDSYGDGWNNANITIKVDGVNYGTATIPSGNHLIVVKPLPPGIITFTWTKGSYDSECSFKIFNFEGTQIYSVATGGCSSFTTGQVFLTYESDCGGPPQSYNIYCNGVLVEEDWQETHYIDESTNPFIINEWCVTASCACCGYSDRVCAGIDTICGPEDTYVVFGDVRNALNTYIVGAELKLKGDFAFSSVEYGPVLSQALGRFEFEDVYTTTIYEDYHYVLSANYSGYQTTEKIVNVSGPTNVGAVILLEKPYKPTNVKAVNVEEEHITITWDAPTVAPMTGIGYKLYLLKSEDQNDPSKWMTLTNAPVSPAMSYNDFSWATLPVGAYKWAVKTCYAGNVISEAEFSNELIKNIEVGYEIKITTDCGNSPLGAIVSLKNTANQYELPATNTGAFFPKVWLGTYTLKVTLAGYEEYTASVEITAAGAHNVVLKVIVKEPADVNIDTLGNTARLTWTHDAAVPFNGFTVYLNGEAVKSGINGFQYLFTNLPNGNYTAAVEANYCANVNSEKVPVSFTILITDISNYDFDYKIYPNPTEGKISVERINATFATIDIYNALGMHINSYETGERIFEINVASLAAGTYFIKITEDEKTSVKSFVKK